MKREKIKEGKAERRGMGGKERFSNYKRVKGGDEGRAKGERLKITRKKKLEGEFWGRRCVFSKFSLL